MMQLRTYLLFPLLAGGVAVASPSVSETAQLSPQPSDAASILESFVESGTLISKETVVDSVEEILVVDRHDRQCRREQRRASRYDGRDSYPRFQFHYYGGRDRDDWDDDDWDDDDWDDDDWDDDDWDDDDRRRYYYRSAPAPYHYYTQPRYYYYRH